jgi:Secretion system C-terminal sorting domain
VFFFGENNTLNDIVVAGRVVDNKIIELAKLGADKIKYSDSLLEDNSTYYYRLKAFGVKTESDVAVAKANTAQILFLEEDLANIFTLYPNPTSTEIHLKFTKPTTGKISIFNTVGIILFETELKNQVNLMIMINVSHFRNGVYFVKFRGLEGVFCWKGCDRVRLGKPMDRVSCRYWYFWRNEISIKDKTPSRLEILTAFL